jgi:phosphate transport system substrate-binding protein
VRSTRLAVALTLVVAVSVGGSASAAGATLSGAGSTVAAQVVGDWATGFQAKTGTTVSYRAGGFTDGITEVSAGQIDFGVSDVPMTTSQETACGGGQCVTIPWALTATGISYNIPGVHTGLRLTGKILAGIYLGTITNWDNPAIAAINKTLKLPNLKITPTWQSAPSGDTYAFTNYLEDVAPATRKKLGVDASTATWPVGIGASGSAGVMADISRTSGSIGYANDAYLAAQGANVAAIRNTAGNFESPTRLTVPEAAARPEKITPTGIHIVDPPKSEKIAYPIASFVYVIVPTAPPQATLLKPFLTYCITLGRDAGLSADFDPIPPAVVKTDRTLINKLS